MYEDSTQRFQLGQIGVSARLTGDRPVTSPAIRLESGRRPSSPASLTVTW